MSMQTKLSTLWVFVTLNSIYRDVTSLQDHDVLRQYLAGDLGGLQLTQGFLLAAAVYVEIKVAMVVLSRVLGHRANRRLNIAAGACMTLVQVATLPLGSGVTGYDVFFSVMVATTTAYIAWSAFRWSEPDVRCGLRDLAVGDRPPM